MPKVGRIRIENGKILLETTKKPIPFLKTKWKKVVTKSQAGVKYTKWKQVIVDEPKEKKMNRWGRRQEMKRMLRLAKKIK